MQYLRRQMCVYKCGSFVSWKCAGLVETQDDLTYATCFVCECVVWFARCVPHRSLRNASTPA